MRRFQDKVVLITVAATVIGLATVHRIHNEGGIGPTICTVFTNIPIGSI